ncbi:hypothetical protein KAU33_15580 [Candidatus Dependentiae bacterium]|nr:hypothetical protein [Candidatus Dependentiae bacterium]
MTRYYVHNSSIFDTMLYDVPAIKEAIKNAGGKNVRTSRYMGWSNQPDVVTFSASPNDIKLIGDKTSAELGGLAATWGLIIFEKEW